jgi:hypothetical protein
VALIAGSGFAYAQGTGTGAAPAGSTAQQSAPSSDRGASSAGSMNRDSAPDTKSSDQGMKSTQSNETMQPQGSKNQRAQDDMKAGAKGEKSAQDNMRGEKSKSMSSETKDNAKGGAKDMKAEDRNDSKMNNAQSKEGRTGANPTATNQGASDNRSQTTTGNAATSATAAPPAEKQTQIASAIRSERVDDVTNVNFNVSVGAVVPGSVRFHSLPSRIVEIYPEWRGYEFIRVHGRYVIVRPQTHEIVYIIEG